MKRNLEPCSTSALYPDFVLLVGLNKLISQSLWTHFYYTLQELQEQILQNSFHRVLNMFSPLCPYNGTLREQFSKGALCLHFVGQNRHDIQKNLLSLSYFFLHEINCKFLFILYTKLLPSNLVNSEQLAQSISMK